MVIDAIGVACREGCAVLGGFRIRTKLLLVVLVPLLAIVVLAVAAGLVLREAAVGGPRSDDILQSKDLVADVLPPPAFLVESFLTVQQINNASGSEITRLVARLNSQHTAYLDSIAKWERLESDPAIRARLLTDAHQPALEFFTIVDTEFIPAVQNRDTDLAAQLATDRLETLFEEHRQAIIGVVQLAIDREASTKSTTASFVNRSQIALLALLAGVLGLALALGLSAARSIVRPVKALHRIATQELPAAIEALKAADIEGGAEISIPKIDLGTRDELGDAATAFNEVVGTAVGLAADQAKLRQHTADLMINLGKRNQVLLGSQLELLDQLEGNVQEPVLLDGLFELDHLATRMRRNAESLLVLAGSRRSRSWAKPVLLSEVIQGAAAELSDYRRVDVVVSAEDDVQVSGQHTVDVAHLLAEVIENALQFSPPSAQVLVRTQRSKQGVRVWISDLGIGMTEQELVTANDRINRPPEIDELNADQVGFLVIARLSLRIDARVRLQPNPAGGLAASVDLPRLIFLVDEQPAALGRPVRESREEIELPDQAPARPAPSRRVDEAVAPGTVRTAPSTPDDRQRRQPATGETSQSRRPASAASESAASTRSAAPVGSAAAAPAGTQRPGSPQRASTGQGQATGRRSVPESADQRPAARQATAPAAQSANGPLPRRGSAGTEPAVAGLPRRTPAPVPTERSQAETGVLPRRAARPTTSAVDDAAVVEGFDLFGGTEPTPAKRRSLGDFTSGVRQVRDDSDRASEGNP